LKKSSPTKFLEKELTNFWRKKWPNLTFLEAKSDPTEYLFAKSSPNKPALFQKVIKLKIPT